MSFDSAFKTVSALVNDFNANKQHYLNPSYSEADVRNDFINKFFIALGWDVRHETQKNPYEQEVRVEKPLQIAKAQKRADYSFSLAPDFRTVKFFVEAKKPAHDLSNKDYYFQTSRYGWNANTPVAVLTDFEEFHIVDCRFRPNIDDSLNYKLKQFHYSNYADQEKFAEIYWLFSREAVADGSIEKYAEALPKPRGKKAKAVKGVAQSIDEAFLEELDEIRNNLAKSFKKNNEHLTSEELTEATQRTIDRLVFIKFLEDKLIEPDHYVSEFGGRKSAWEDFLIDSRKLDAKYNGVVFKKSIIDTRNLIEPDDKTFSSICDGLSHENTPYNFDAIPIHILGSIYERFLGKVVHATDKRATIEEKPEVRKAGGVYYTPQYIVNYIVENIVGKLIDGKTPRQIAKMRFADIACGSGSFLITVFETLLDYHKQYYQQNTEQAKKDGCILYEGAYRLSLKQKQQILTNNIYGVDIDQQAVEVTQLSLYLKLLEDETTATANDTWVLFKEQLLPDLNKNIVCGNSLIGTDILDLTPAPLLTKERGTRGEVDELKIKPMDFENVFPEVMKVGGFDAIVGNPPYIRIQGLHENQPSVINYYKLNYSAAKSGNFDIYVLFNEKAFNLVQANGFVGYIQPHKFFQADFGEGIRNYLAKKAAVHKIVHFGANQIFKDATTYTCLLFLSKSKNSKIEVEKVDNPSDWEIKKEGFEIFSMNQPIVGEKWNFNSTNNLKVLDKLKKQSKTLGDIAEKIFVGLQTSADKVFVLDIKKWKPNVLSCHSSSLNKEIEIEVGLVKPFLMGKDVKRYEQSKADKVVIFPYIINNGKAVLMSEDYIHTNFPLGWKYLFENKTILKSREKGKFKDTWWQYGRSNNLSEFDSQKLITPEIANYPSMTTDEKGEFYHTTKVYGLTFNNVAEHSNYFLALLNSKILWFFLKSTGYVLRGGYFTFKTEYLKPFPLKMIDFKSEVETKVHNNLRNLVTQMLEAKKQLQQAKTEGDKNYFTRKCERLDKEIDQLVYQLYGLTEEEIKIVEGKTSS